MTNEEKTLLRIQALLFFATYIARIFFNVFLFKLGNFKIVVLYNFYYLTFLLVWYLVSGWFLKRFSSRTLIRFGLLCLTFGWGLLSLLKEKSINFLLPLGFIFGTGLGNFWSGFNLSQYILTQQKTREKFFAQANMLINLACAFGPLIGGGIIFYGQQLFFSEVQSYALVFLTLTLINALNFVLTTKKLPRHSRIEFSIKQVISHKRSYNWRLVLIQQFLAGLWDITLGTLTTVLLFIIFKKELALGTIITIWAIIVALANLVAGKLLSKNKKMLVFGMIGASLGVLLFSLFQDWLGVLSLLIIYGISIPFLNIPLMTAVLNTIDDVKNHWQKKYHFLIEREFLLDLGRILSHLFLFLLFSKGNQILLAKQWLKFISILPLIMGILIFLMKPQKK